MCAHAMHIDWGGREEKTMLIQTNADISETQPRVFAQQFNLLKYKLQIKIFKHLNLPCQTTSTECIHLDIYRLQETLGIAVLEQAEKHRGNCRGIKVEHSKIAQCAESHVSTSLHLAPHLSRFSSWVTQYEDKCNYTICREWLNRNTTVE